MDGSPAAHAFASAFEEGGGDALAPTVEMIPGVPGAFLIRGAFSKEEAESLGLVVRLAHTSEMPRRDSGLTTTRRGSQHHKPVRVHVADLASFAKRIRPFLPAVAGPNCDSELAEPGLEVSEFLRCYLYLEGESSRPHYDRSFSKSANHVQTAFSAYSMLLYLTDACEGAGGQTTFFAPDPKLEVSADGFTVKQDRCELAIAATVVPSCGDVLIFPHGKQSGCHPSPLHEGSPVVHGEKLLIRTDVMYNCPAPRKGKKQGKIDLIELGAE